MYAVIFRARVAQLDDAYASMAAQLRQLALDSHGCREFRSWLQGDEEVAISYWDDLDSIAAWKRHPLHRQAQEAGKTRWYRSYSVDVVEVVRHYDHAQP
ncbi:antibiotic biosynthesis monooxygenase [Pseudohalioglobus sediminis]|uniref:Antibiotic biosynthesis monooxygenase n=1 Tax=Pseudohalioglobus sediminis TaxID=2606449 RepID=A0A5B0WTT0_9GAMM|nr:antibiotic biosynthesis monooxygenase [Pseudohalioglobus sediminis]KAA1189601.1 antibiotic biosynthesis monooxygenase [Pseudohalioglobus sediminis]